jgi:hypothetical protein
MPDKLYHYNIILQNIRSLRKNFDTFLTNIYAIGLDFDLILFTETWISTSEISDFSLDGFSFHANCNDLYRAGGVAAFVRSSLIYDVNSVQFSSADVMKISIQLGNVKFCFVLIYRFHFVPFNIFLNELKNFLNTDKSKHKVLLGDVNIDLLKDSQIKDDYLLLCATHGMEPLLISVTRPISNSCIDHVFSENLCEQFTMELKNMNLYVTDHTTIQLTLKLMNKKKKAVNMNTYIKRK